MVNTYCDNSERTFIESCTKKNKGKEGIEEFCPETGVLKRIWHYYKREDDGCLKEMEFVKM